MTAAWTKDQLDRLGEAQEIRVAGRRRDGSLRRPVIVWAVRVGDDLFTRSVNGADAAWFRGTRVRREGHICADGVQDALDAAYRRKYGQYPGPVAAITSPPAHATTLKLVPHAAPPR